MNPWPLASWLLLSAFASAPARPAPARPAPRAPAPNGAAGLSTTAGVFRVLVERVVQNASLTLDFAAKPEAPAEGKETVYLHLLVVAPDRDRAGALVGLGSNLFATTDAGQQVPLRAYSGSEGGRADGKSARVCMLAQEVDVRARRLRAVEGELLVYPRSRSVRVEFNLGAHKEIPLPQTQTVEGLQVTLQEFRIENGEARAVLSQQWSAGTSVTRLRPEIPFGALALTAAGVPAYPSAERSETLDKPNGEQSRRYRLVFPDVKQRPEKLVLEALVRSGEPEPVRFRLTDIPLRDGAGDPPGAAAAGPATNPNSLHPDLSARGGVPLRLKVRVNGQPAGAGILSVGLKPATTPNAPWRWLTLATDANGTAQVSNLKPGRYRATLRWSPASGSPLAQGPPAAGAGLWLNDQPEFTATVGKPLALPVLEWRGQ